MPTPLEQSVAQAAHHKLFWLILGGSVVALLIAFWMLCSQQVQRAEVRQMAVRQQQTAIVDCLNYLAASTPATCARRDPTAPSTVAVNFVR